MQSSGQPYIVSARKYRPATFRSVVGQGALTSTLKNAIDSGRLAQAYLFCGPRGVGKTSCARIFAKTINCLHPTADGEACGECDSCRAMDRGNSFNIIELDAASNNSVGDIRQLIEQVNVPPQVGRYRVFIIDEVHMLSSQAFNAFLKTLEEPPSYVIFILATTEKHKVIPTILSRCQIYDFKRITVGDMADHLRYVADQEGIETEAKALDVIARKADGAMRDALSIFDQVTAAGGGRVTYRSAIENLNVLDYDYYFRLIDAFTRRDVVESLLIFKEIRDKGFDAQFFVNGLASHIRDLMVAASPSTVALLEVSPDVAARYTEQARSLPLPWYYEALRLCNRCDLDYRTVSDKRLHVELCLINLCRIGEVEAAPAAAAPQSPQKPVQPQAAPAQPQPRAAEPQPAQAQAPAQGAPRPQAVRQQVRPQGVRPSGASARAPQTVRLNAPRPSAQRPAQPAEKSAAPAPTPAGESKPVDMELLRAAWARYIEDNPTKHMVLSTMRMASLTAEGAAVKVTVDSDASRQVLEAEMFDLTPALRRMLGNDGLTLSVEADATAVRERKLTPQQFLTQTVADNAVIRNLVTGLDLEFE